MFANAWELSWFPPPHPSLISIALLPLWSHLLTPTEPACNDVSIWCCRHVNFELDGLEMATSPKMCHENCFLLQKMPSANISSHLMPWLVSQNGELASRYLKGWWDNCSDGWAGRWGRSHPLTWWNHSCVQLDISVMWCSASDWKHHKSQTYQFSVSFCLKMILKSCLRPCYVSPFSPCLCFSRLQRDAQEGSCQAAVLSWKVCFVEKKLCQIKLAQEADKPDLGKQSPPAFPLT